MTFDTPPVYRTYILRFWEERSPSENKAAAWRYSLEDTETNVRHVFNDLNGLIVFLKRQVTLSL